MEKLRSTYGESLLAEVQADGRIHASFGQTVAGTGRISSDRPNLHNIPVRTELGKQFRRAFVPAEPQFPGGRLRPGGAPLHCPSLQDPGLIDALTTGSDVHRMVAAAVYGIPPEEVTHTQREFCKMVSYGLAYGMEAYGLSQRLGVPVEEAAAIMEKYFGVFPLVKQYMDATVADAKIRGATRTPFGRIRPLPDLHASNYRLRQAAERQAMNAFRSSEGEFSMMPSPAGRPIWLWSIKHLSRSTLAERTHRPKCAKPQVKFDQANLLVAQAPDDWLEVIGVVGTEERRAGSSSEARHFSALQFCAAAGRESHCARHGRSGECYSL